MPKQQKLPNVFKRKNVNRTQKIRKTYVTVKDKHGPTPSTKQSTCNILETEIQILKQFDLDVKYGPCIDLSRMERYNRAVKLNLNPPTNVKDILTKHQEWKYQASWWNNYKVFSNQNSDNHELFSMLHKTT